MQLFLWRHADATIGIPDSERPLSESGLRQAKVMAKWLDLVLPPDSRIFVSPAMRTRQTADVLGRSYITHSSVALGSTSQDILSAVGWPDADQTVLIIGHQPVLGHLASFLLNGHEREWHVERCNVWWIDTKSARHQDTILKAVVSPSLLDGLMQLQLKSA